MLESNLAKIQYGDESPSRPQIGTVAGLIRSGLPGSKQDKDEYYGLFLQYVYNTDSAKNLLKCETSSLINWMMWDGAQSFTAYREEKPHITGIAKSELVAVVKKVLNLRNDPRYLDIVAT